jgi:hypothetical protein
MVRVPRGDPGAICAPVQGSRAVGLGSTDSAAPCDQDPACEAEAGGRSGLAVLQRADEEEDRTACACAERERYELRPRLARRVDAETRRAHGSARGPREVVDVRDPKHRLRRGPARQRDGSRADGAIAGRWLAELAPGQVDGAHAGKTAQRAGRPEVREAQLEVGAAGRVIALRVEPDDERRSRTRPRRRRLREGVRSRGRKHDCKRRHEGAHD